MSNLTISIFGNKVFFEIINEIKLFPKYKIKYYEDLDLCVKEAEKYNLLSVFFVDTKVKLSFDRHQMRIFPSIFIGQNSTFKNMFPAVFEEQLNMPFSILEFKKKLF